MVCFLGSIRANPSSLTCFSPYKRQAFFYKPSISVSRYGSSPFQRLFRACVQSGKFHDTLFLVLFVCVFTIQYCLKFDWVGVMYLGVRMCFFIFIFCISFDLFLLDMKGRKLKLFGRSLVYSVSVGTFFAIQCWLKFDYMDFWALIFLFKCLVFGKIVSL